MHVETLIYKSKPKAIIVDIDGTIAQKHPDRDIYDYTKVGMDLPIQHVIDIIQHLVGINTNEIIFVSGRSDICRKDTMRWLKSHVLIGYSGVIYNYTNPSLFMRKEGDYRDDTIIKREIYEEHIKFNYDVIAVFDDRPKVLRMWRELGLFTFNVQQSENEF